MAWQASSSSSFTYRWTYDVFLSFRGEDSRFGFTGNLYNALNQRGIHTFIDDKQLERGETITPALLTAIENSRIAVIVLSQNYASSTFCLDELVKILECLKGQGRLVWPIFYGVDPSDVRHQRGSYGAAMAKHEDRFQDNKQKVQKWRWALHQVANLSGWHFKHGDEYEYEFIGRIIKEVSSKINHTPLHIANYPVGLASRVLKVTSLLNLEQDDRVLMIGIFGIGGIGKTTIARAVYNLIADSFQGLCFLDDVRDNQDKHGLLHLQERLLSDIIGEKDIKLGNVNRGIPIIKHRLQCKKVLLILDDVDKLQQLQAIVGGLDWFGFGSRIIITTRDKHLLTSHGVEKTYEVKKLNQREALELLSWNAFKNNEVDATYMDSVNRAVSYASGLPLALEVIGSNLCGKNKEEWNSALDKYERIPIKKVQKVLKVSYDALEEDEQKIFLDIACHFKGDRLAYVEDMLYAHHGVNPKYGIGVLIEKSLIQINHDELTMHDLVRDMGREIVRQESVHEPGKRSRLWFFKDIIDVLEENMGTERIEVITLDLPKDEKEEVHWDGKAFKKLTNLKILIIRNVCFSEGPRHLPNSLNVLEWCEYPSPCLPTDFCPKKLAVLKMPHSCLVSFEPSKKMRSLTVLNFSKCEFISKIPNVSNIPNLIELSVKECSNLIEIHDTVGFLKKLRILDASDCSKLKTFPHAIMLPSLEYLSLEYCSNLESFPQILERMENITELDLTGTAIKELPFSIWNLSRLQKLDMEFCRNIHLPSSILMLPELREISAAINRGLQLSDEEDKSNQEKLGSMPSSKVEKIDLSYSHISDASLSLCLTWFANVKDLNLRSTNFTILPACIKDCHFLRKIDLIDCKHVQEIKGLPPYIQDFSARNCTSLTFRSKSMLLNQVLHEGKNFCVCVPGAKIPDRFDYNSRGGLSISFWFRDKLPALALSVVVGPVEYGLGFAAHVIPNLIINNSKHTSDISFKFDVVATDHILVFDLEWIKFEDTLQGLYFEKEWNHVEISYEFSPSSASSEMFVKESGIHVLKQKNSMEDIQFINPYKRRKLDDVHVILDLTNHPWLKGSHAFVDVAVSDSEIPSLEQQQDLASITPQVEQQSKSISSPPPPAVYPLDDGELHLASIISPWSGKELKQQHLYAISKQNFVGTGTVNKAKRKRTIASNSSNEEEKDNTLLVEQPSSSKEYQVTSERDQPASHDKTLTSDTIELNQKEKLVPNVQSIINDQADDEMGFHQRRNWWRFCLCSLISSIVSLCSSSSCSVAVP